MTGRSEVITTFIHRPPKEQHSAAFKIFHYRFICLISQIHLYTPEYIEQGGYPTSGNPEEDRALAKSKVYVQLTIAAMAEYHAQGVSFNLADHQDAVTIYRILERHLNDWRHCVSEQFNMTQPPLDDLRKFEDLASAIHPYAAGALMASERHTRLSDKLQAITKGRGGVTREAPVRGSQGPSHQHTPVVDYIARQVSERSKSWR